MNSHLAIECVDSYSWRSAHRKRPAFLGSESFRINFASASRLGDGDSLIARLLTSHFSLCALDFPLRLTHRGINLTLRFPRNSDAVDTRSHRRSHIHFH